MLYEIYCFNRYIFLFSPYIIVIWAGIEYARLMFAQEGNILCKVDKLSASLLMTFFPHLPIIFYFGVFQDLRYIVEEVLFTIMAIITLLEVGLIMNVLKGQIQLNRVALIRAYQNDEKKEENQSKFIA